LLEAEEEGRAGRASESVGAVDRLRLSVMDGQRHKGEKVLLVLVLDGGVDFSGLSASASPLALRSFAGWVRSERANGLSTSNFNNKNEQPPSFLNAYLEKQSFENIYIAPHEACEPITRVFFHHRRPKSYQKPGKSFG